MQKTKIIKLLLLLLVLLITPKNYFSQDLSGESLKGVESVTIPIPYNYILIKGMGLTTEGIKTDVEMQLQRSGIKVKPYPGIGSNLLQLNVVIFEGNSGGISGIVSVALRDSVMLSRNKSISFGAEVWEKTEYVIAENQDPKHFREVISRMVNDFITAYYKANTSTAKQIDNLPDLSKYATKTPPLPQTKQDDSPFTATYVGGNNPPTIEVFNDTNRTLYLDLGQGKMTAYTILSGASQKITLTEGNYNYRASAPRVKTLEGKELFQKGYVYSWRFTIITVPR
jgi:hypothetical protein